MSLRLSLWTLLILLFVSSSGTFGERIKFQRQKFDRSRFDRTGTTVTPAPAPAPAPVVEEKEEEAPAAEPTGSSSWKNGSIQRALADTDTLLLVTADHGHMQTDTPINLAEIPGFYDTLTSLPSGDSRMAQCFVRPARVRKFLQMTRTAPFLGNCACVPHAEVLRSGVLGPGTPHPALRNRLGDYVLFAAPGVAFLYPPALSTYKKAMKGNHGGLSSDELDVPLFVVRP